MESPSEQSIWSATRLAVAFYRRNEELPKRIVMDGEGGICMEHCDLTEPTSYEIDKDGRIEKLCFRSSRLVSREDVVLETAKAATV